MEVGEGDHRVEEEGEEHHQKVEEGHHQVVEEEEEEGEGPPPRGGGGGGGGGAFCEGGGGGGEAPLVDPRRRRGRWGWWNSAWRNTDTRNRWFWFFPWAHLYRQAPFQAAPSSFSPQEAHPQS